MNNTKEAVEELQREVERLRAFAEQVHSLSQELVDGEGVVHEEAVGALRAEMERLRGLVFTDELTGVLNRRGFYDRFTKLFEEALYVKQHTDTKRSFQVADFSVVFIDLDNFKTINDIYGHDVGDSVLKEAARLFQRLVRDIDGVARLGGEEFVLALVGASEMQAYDKAEQIRGKLEQSIKIPGAQNHTVTGSFGVAGLSTSDADDLDELVGYADKAMYEAKTKRGKNIVVKHSELIK